MWCSVAMWSLWVSHKELYTTFNPLTEVVKQCQWKGRLIRLPGMIVRKTSCFTTVFLLYFFSTWDLRGPLADLRKILPHGRKHVQFYNADPKIYGPAQCPPPPKKIGGQKYAKSGPISDPFPLWVQCIFCRMDRDIQKRKTKLSTAFPLALDEISPVNCSPLSTAFSWLMFTHQIDFFRISYFGP